MPTERVNLPNEVLLPEVARLLAEGNSVTLRATGNSMYPFIHGGRDCVVMHRPGQLQVGDIVLAHTTDGRYVLHRIQSIGDTEIILKGDGNVTGTESCRPTDIAGKVSVIVRKGKEIDCSSRGEQRKVRLWNRLSPFRRYILGICRRWNKWKEK